MGKPAGGGPSRRGGGCVTSTARGTEARPAPTCGDVGASVVLSPVGTSEIGVTGSDSRNSSAALSPEVRGAAGGALLGTPTPGSGGRFVSGGRVFGLRL